MLKYFIAATFWSESDCLMSLIRTLRKENNKVGDTYKEANKCQQRLCCQITPISKTYCLFSETYSKFPSSTESPLPPAQRFSVRIIRWRGLNKTLQQNKTLSFASERLEMVLCVHPLLWHIWQVWFGCFCAARRKGIDRKHKLSHCAVVKVAISQRDGLCRC